MKNNISSSILIENGSNTENTTAYLSIHGMHCSSCAITIENYLRKIPGVYSAFVLISEETAEISYNPNQISIQNICEAIEKIGYKATPVSTETDQIEDSKSDNGKRVIINTILAIPIVTASMYFADSYKNRVFQFIFASIILAFPARIFYKNSYYAVKNKSLNMDFLISIAITVSWLISTIATFLPSYLPSFHMIYFESTALLSLFILFGKWLESKVKDLATKELKNLSIIENSKIIKIFDDQDEILIPVNKLQTNDIVKILPSQMIPVDGIIIKGETSVDEKLITGESIPVVKHENDHVVSGSINLTSVIFVKVTKCGATSTINSIIRAMRRAQIEKPSIQRLADTIASSYFIPTVFTISIATFFYWLLFQNSLEKAIIHSITVLVTACPCALGLATPMALGIACFVAYKNGILIKKPSSLEILRNINFIMFDKTNTLTPGNPEVKDFYIYNFKTNSLVKEFNTTLSSNQDTFIRHLYHFYLLSNSSIHPLSKAISKWFYLNLINNKSEKYTIDSDKIFNTIEEIKGFGVIGITNKNHKYIIGNKILLEKNGVEILNHVDRIISDETTVVYLAVNNKLFGIIGLVDEIPKENIDVIHQIKEMQIKTIVVSGDRLETVKYICQKAGIDEYYYAQTPHDKLQKVKDYKIKGKVCFIGDGFNDALALASADVGISLGHGADLAKVYFYQWQAEF